MPHHLSFATSDPEAAGRHIAGYTQGRCRVSVSDLGSPFDFESNQAIVGTSTVRRLKWTGDGTYETLAERTASNQVLVHIPLEGEFTAICGRNRVHIDAESGLLIGAGGVVRRSWRGHCELLNLYIDKSMLQVLSDISYQSDANTHFVIPGLAVADGPKLIHIKRFCDFLFAIPAGPAGNVLDQDIGADAERFLLRLLLGAFSADFNRQPRPRDIEPVPYYVARVRSYIYEHAAEQLALEDLITIAGVSERSLHYGFRKFLNVSPMQYVKSVRLELSRAALVTARKTGRKISDVALSAGYSSISRFSQDYKDRYGESPSTTRQFRE